jgi:excisionase family DNA binding protein
MAISLNPTAAVGALKIKGAADYLGISVISLRRAVKDGRIKANRSFRILLFPISELDRFLVYAKPRIAAKKRTP